MIQIRTARQEDISCLEKLIPLSARTLQAAYYSREQIEGALGAIFAVDRQLIEDRTYFVTTVEKEIVGCGGWSFRKTLCGGEKATALRENTVLDPAFDAARLRAFFVHPAWARKGIGALLLKACEKALKEARFARVEILATLSGEPLYLRFGYRADLRYELDLPHGNKLPVVRLLKEFD